MAIREFPGKFSFVSKQSYVGAVTMLLVISFNARNNIRNLITKCCYDIIRQVDDYYLGNV